MADKKEAKEEKKEVGEVGEEEKKGLLSKLDPTKALAGVVPEKKKPGNLVKGDYVVQVHIIEGRDLKGRGMGAMSDPVTEVKCMDKTHHTKILPKQLNPYWDEVMVFEFKDCYPEQIERGKVVVHVKDSNTFRRDVLIGSFEFDLATIYYRDNHELYRQWCALSDVTDKNEGIQGYLKLSIVVLGPNDEQFIHSEKDADDDDGSMLGVLMPPEVEQKGKLLKLRVLELLELPEMDEGVFGTKADPYVRVEFAGIDIRTKHFKGQDIRDFQQEIQVPVMEPIMSTAIKIGFWDWDAAGTNDRISNIRMDYEQIKAAPGSTVAPRWYPLYGAPEGKQMGNTSKAMNNGFLPGTYYRGKALMSFNVEDNPEPKKDVVTCNGLSPAERPEEIQWVVKFDLYEGSEIADKGEMFVEVCCGRHQGSSEKSQVKEGRCEWYAPIKDLVFTGPKDPTQVADVFVYLSVKKKLEGLRRVSYIRLPFEALVKRGWRVPPAWYILAEDKVYDALTEDEFPGALLFSVTVGPLEEAPNEPFPETRPLKYDIEFVAPPSLEEKGAPAGVGLGPAASPSASPSPSTGISSQPSIASESTSYRRRADDDKVAIAGTLRLTVCNAIKLPALDDGKSSDPYVKLSMGRQEFKTKVIKKTLDPVWNETFEFKDVTIDQKISISVFDQDMLRDELMGTFETDVRSQQIEARAGEGKDFTHTGRFFVADKYPNAKIELRFEFKFLELARAQEVVKKQTEQKVKEQKSILAKIGITKVSKSPGGGGVLGYPQRKNFQLRCHIYQARNLPAVDDNGLADPYVVVRFCGKKIKMSRRNETLNPQWYESSYTSVVVPVAVGPNPFVLSPRIQLFVFDHDQLGKDDPIGRMSLTCEEVVVMNPSIHELRPKWFPLSDFEGKEIPDCKILATFQLLLPAETEELPPVEKISIKPPTMPMFLEITTLGLRNLQSTLGVHKTFIDFELPTGKRFHTRQSKIPTPKNPNFLQVLKIPVDLPIQAIFSPQLNVEVRDVMLGGFVKRLIGTSSLDMGKFMQEDEKGSWRPATKKVELGDPDAIPGVLDAAGRAEVESKLKAQAEKKIKNAGEFKTMLATAQRAAEDEKTAPAEGKEEGKRSDERKTEVSSDDGKSPAGKKPAKDELSKPLLSSHSDDPEPHEEVKVEVKDTGEGIGDLGITKDDQNPLAQSADEKKEGGFKEGGPTDGDKYDPTKDVEEEDPEAETPVYMKGRVIVDDELEDYMQINPFHSIAINTGKTNAGKLGKSFRRVGTFKGLVRLMESKDEPSPFDLQDMLNPQELFCRLYILRGHSLSPKDSDGASDPYLIVKLGNHRFSTRDRYIKNDINPGFFERFEIPCTLPGDARLEIAVWDWDGIGDDLIGVTELDIEDRWFTKEWKDLPLKPLERRTLKTKSSNRSQGKLELWVELLTPEQAKKSPMWDIKPPAPEPYELRVIVWGTREITIKDELTNQNDLFVTGALSVKGAKKQETDTHWRSKKGKANFNWRMKWTLELPSKPWPRLRFQIWDLDIFSPNDSICETVLTLKGLCKRALKKKDRVKIYMDGKDRWYLKDLRHPNFKGNQGRMEISIELMPQAIASQLPAGLGRSDPNTNPFLPPPEGRVNWSLLHPFDMLKEILGPELYRKMCFGCCCMLFVAACVFMAPMIVSNLITNILTP